MSVSFATTYSQNAIKDLNISLCKDLKDAKKLMKTNWDELHPEKMKQAQHDKNYQTSFGSLDNFRSDKMGAEQHQHQYKSFPEAMGEKPNSSTGFVVTQLTDADEENIQKYKEFQKLFRKFCKYSEVPFPLYKELLVIAYAHSEKRVLSFMTDKTIKIVLDYWNPGGEKASAVISHLKTLFRQAHASDDSDIGSVKYFVRLGFSQEDARYLKEEHYSEMCLKYPGPKTHITQKQKTDVAKEVVQKFTTSGALTAHRFLARVDDEVLCKLEIVRGKIKQYQQQQEVQPALPQAEAISSEDLQPSTPTTPPKRVTYAAAAARLRIATTSSPRGSIIETHRISLISIVSPATSPSNKGSISGSARKSKYNFNESPKNTDGVRRALVFSPNTSPNGPRPLWSEVAASPRATEVAFS